VAGYRFLLSGLVLSAVVLTGLRTQSSTAQTPTFAQLPSLLTSQAFTAAAALPGIQDAASDPDISLPTKSPTGSAVTLPDPTTKEENRANEESEAIAAIVSEMSGFGGIWVDEAGITHVAVQHGKARDFAKALKERPKGGHILYEVEFSYKDLVSHVNSISRQMETLKTHGLDLLEWGPDEKNNTVWISLRVYTEEKAALAREVLGEDIIVRPATVAGDENDLFSRTGDSPR
jgi:hypothetical protein